MKIVILTVSEANDDVTAALNAGAQGYVLKGVGSKMLAEILHERRAAARPMCRRRLQRACWRACRN